MKYKSLVNKIPEFCMSHWLIRIPLIIIFLQQGISKLPVTVEGAESFDLPYIVWWFAAWGEVGAGLGLLVGGLFPKKYLWELGDIITRFSGITICSIMTGVIWVGEPSSLMDVILYDNLHVLLWVAGLYFALRGNRT
tara:strand:- start:108 stop:518 length:411 start_codon:yes stop_codon:yes gene_type:complete